VWLGWGVPIRRFPAGDAPRPPRKGLSHAPRTGVLPAFPSYPRNPPPSSPPNPNPFPPPPLCRRLKVHYRAPPDVRGSGRERGHGRELTHCPKCAAPLEAGRHHVGCSAGPVAPRQAAKRLRQVREGKEGAEARGGVILVDS
jgi:hypothetical protein